MVNEYEKRSELTSWVPLLHVSFTFGEQSSWSEDDDDKNDDGSIIWAEITSPQQQTIE